MVSRLLSALDARIAKTRDPLRHACLSAERATLLARQGRLDEASSELERIRARYAAKPNAVVTAWVCLGEGMVAFYASLAPSARDKFMRAYALSAAVEDRGVRCLSAGWLAHLDYLDQSFEKMIDHLSTALEANSDDHSSHERSSLVVAQAFHWANRFELAQPWYERARWYATNVGDESLLSALMHNMAWLHMVEARRRSLLRVANTKLVPSVLLSAEAIENFDLLVGTASLQTLVPMLRAHVLSVLERYSEATELFEAYLSDALTEGLARIECSILAEIAWCRVNVGSTAEAREFVHAARAKLHECNQPDELAATHGRLALACRALGEYAAAESHQVQATLEWERHQARQAALVALLSRFQTVAPYGPNGSRGVGDVAVGSTGV